jgi:hypothetical protein
MNRYFYKLINQTDFVWEIEASVNDTYRKNNINYGIFVSNKRQFIGYSFKST